MGNRAIVKPINENIGVYLHWNGGIDSVTAFLEYCKLKGYRDFGGKHSDSYGIARFTQVVSNFFGGKLSIGIETNIDETEECAKGLDNGIYVIDGWDIVKRIGGNEYHEGYDLKEMLVSIDEAQPLEEQLGENFLTSEVVDVSEINIGDEVYVANYDGKYNIFKVMGFCDSYIGDKNVKVPYVNQYERINSDGTVDYTYNINNHLRVDKVRRYKKCF